VGPGVHGKTGAPVPHGDLTRLKLDTNHDGKPEALLATNRSEAGCGPEMKGALDLSLVVGPESVGLLCCGP
jgi:hypothetical protein